jgi:hypothetical protein
MQKQLSIETYRIQNMVGLQIIMPFTSLYLWCLFYEELAHLKSAFYVFISVNLLAIYNKYKAMQTITFIINNKNIKNPTRFDHEGSSSWRRQISKIYIKHQLQLIWIKTVYDVSGYPKVHGR